MPRGAGPEEFFEALREVQQGKKRPEGEASEAVPVAPAACAPEIPGAGGVSLSYPAAAGGIVIVLLLVVLAYLVGRQHGWRSYEAALRGQGEKQGEKATTATPGGRPLERTAPELVDGLVFTLLTLRGSPADRESVEKEAEFLNKYAPFQALGVEAYAWRDRGGKYRLCARGLKSMDEATRKQVRDQIRNLVSRQGRREYRDCDFLPP